ncbi:MAG TPA: hypothetical protein VFF86_02310 [Candidatus Methylomirabilis sp.]|nr:hypothetical protein [Candidatus Methylomirabilis sp.]
MTRDLAVNVPRLQQFDAWLERYKDEHRDLIDADPDFADWLAGDYVPIAGGWHY